MCGGEQPVWEVRMWSSWAWWLCVVSFGREIFYLKGTCPGRVLAVVSYERICHRKTAGAQCNIICHNRYDIRTLSCISDCDTGREVVRGSKGFIEYGYILRLLNRQLLSISLYSQWVFLPQGAVSPKTVSFDEVLLGFYRGQQWDVNTFWIKCQWKIKKTQLYSKRVTLLLFLFHTALTFNIKYIWMASLQMAFNSTDSSFSLFAWVRDDTADT